MYHITKMTRQFVEEISRWTYPVPYHLYSFEPSEELSAELLGGEYVACLDENLEPVGYFCFGKSAQIPTVEKYPYPSTHLDLGLGMKPELCGKGLGREFLACGLAYAKEAFQNPALRLTVAAFNQRAIHLYEHCDFQHAQTVTHSFSNTPFHIMTR